MIQHKGRYAAIAFVGVAFAWLAGCGETTRAADAGAAAATPPGTTDVNESIQEHMLQTVEQTFSARNAKARREGEVVHVRMDGDASVARAGFSDCRLLTQLVRDTSKTGVRVDFSKKRRTSGSFCRG